MMNKWLGAAGILVAGAGLAAGVNAIPTGGRKRRLGSRQVARHGLAATRRANFRIDGPDESPAFAGYTDGETWNGWATPWFGDRVARNIVAYNRSNGYDARYDARHDAFVFYQYRDDEAKPDWSWLTRWRTGSAPPWSDPRLDGFDVFSGEHLRYGDETLHLYPIGRQAWTWREED